MMTLSTPGWNSAVMGLSMGFSAVMTLNLFKLLVFNTREKCSSSTRSRLALAIDCRAVIFKLGETSLVGTGEQASAIDVGLRYFSPRMENNTKKTTKAPMQVMAMPVQCCGNPSDLMTK